MKGLFLLLISLFLFPTCVTAQKWKQEVTHLMALGKYAEAEAICSKELVKHKNPKGKQVSEVIHLNSTLGNIYFKWEKFSTSEKMLNQALNNAKQLLNPKDSVYVIALMNMGEFYAQRGKFTKADSLYDAALGLISGIWKEKNAYYFECWVARGSLAVYKGYFDNANTIFKDKIAEWKISKADSSSYANLLLYYGQVRYLQGYIKEAYLLGNESFNYRKKHQNTNPLLYADCIAVFSPSKVSFFGIENTFNDLNIAGAIFKVFRTCLWVSL